MSFLHLFLSFCYGKVILYSEARGEGERDRSTSRERWSERREDSRRGRDGKSLLREMCAQLD